MSSSHHDVNGYKRQAGGRKRPPHGESVMLRERERQGGMPPPWMVLHWQKASPGRLEFVTEKVVAFECLAE